MRDLTNLGCVVKKKMVAQQKKRGGELRSTIETLSKLPVIWKVCAINRHAKLRLLKTLVFLIFLYSAKTWTIKANQRICFLDVSV